MNISTDSNDFISKMKYSDKEEFLKLLKEYKIELRNKLNMDDSSTFGIEIEYDGNFNNIYSVIKAKDYEWLMNGRLKGTFWKHEIETSIITGGEVISPILVNSPENWKQIDEICKILKNNNCKATNETGGHIHYGTQILGNDMDNWFKFIKLYAAYENILYRFGYGEFEDARYYIYSHANPIAKNFLYTYNKYNLDNIGFKKFIRSLLFTYKGDGIRICGLTKNADFKENKTIEFRSPNGTLEPIIWQNNVNTFYHLLTYAVNKDYDENIIDKRILINKNTIGNMNLYNEINIDQALEFADLIFDNNLDKVNFLRQYFKNFVEINKFEKTKEFIKR